MKRIACALALLAGMACQAADIEVAAASAARPALAAAIPGFERQTGHHVVVDYGDAGAPLERARKDERVDVAVVGVADMGVLARAYRIFPDTRRTLGRTAATAESPQGTVLVAAALKGGKHEDAARALCAYLTLPETIATLRGNGLAAP